MTRFRMALIDEYGNIDYSCEFNGDGGWEGHGEEVYKLLDKIKNPTDLFNYTVKINKKYYGYEDDYVSTYCTDAGLSFESFKEYILAYTSDYLYVKNCSGGEYKFTDTKGKQVTIKPKGKCILYFGEAVEPGEEL